MLRPFLIVGVGGSGGKTIRGLRHALELRLEQAGWKRGIPAAWQMIHFDTPLKQDGTDYVMPFIPATDYKGLVASGASYDGVHASIVAQGIPADVTNDVYRMLPDPARVSVDVTKGAGQFRAVGRAVAVSKLADISRAAANAINRMQDATALGELQSLGEHLGARTEGGKNANPTVIVVSSIAGGSGAGQYLDVIEAVKSVVRNEPWAHQFFALLYAPDVFDQIKGSAGIASNALATVAETMAGFWAQTPSKASLELYRSKGVSPSYGSARDRVGAAYPFIIGRQNSRVAFDNQGDVYSAVSTSISAWMADDKVQGDIDEYVTGNWSASVAASVLPDATKLMRPLDQAPPFSSLGFGRVTLGREKFLDYASERLARSVLDRILYAHGEEDPRFEQRTENEWIEYRKSQALEAFIRDLELDEELDGRDDVINKLRPEQARASLALEFRQQVFDKSAHGFDKTGGLDLNDWHYRLTAAREDLVGGYLARDTAEVEQLVARWVAEAPEHIVDTIERFIARHGLAVVVELMRELSRVLRAASENLAKEADQRRGWLTRVSGRVSEALGAAANADSIRPEQDVVEQALDDIEDSFGWESEANLREVASKLLEELRKDFIEPLADYLSSARQALLSRVTDRVQSDGRENPYDSWPQRIDSTVPRKYKPAPNERLLVPHTEYPAEFERLVENTYERRRYQEAVLDVISDMVRGPGADDGIEAGKRWSFIDIRRGWKPATTGNPAQRTANHESPKFFVANDIDVYQDRARYWMLRKGFPFFGYISENLDSYFNAEEIDPDRLKQRRDVFREGLTAALGASEPLVKLNPALLSEVHGKAVGEQNRLVFSAIPFAEGTEMYEVTKSVLTSAGVWDENISKGWFKDSKVDRIEVFAMSGYPYEPIVMDSVMGPIARGWLTDSTTTEARAAFWKWKRARLLREAVPADPEVFDSMVRGWYVAKVLGQLDVDRSDLDRGPKLSIWDAERREFASFPHPLLYPGAAPAYDYPGVIMESLIIALALCNSEGSLAPLRAYQVLMRLGGQRNVLSPVLTDWLRDGFMPQGSPTPAAERAGTAAGTLSERQTAVREHLDKELSDFRDEVEKQNTETSVFAYPVSWEIRDTIQGGLRELRDGVLETKPDSTGI
ncbi:tubulin-like doman-containing protein [Homoserinibacter gongjuensis]|uniref:Tubulin-like protein n=1 Tax=Homoserinibacter gongjuensis TaxID=1162968 RepID=A0ABQ6JZZ7_9MICO|nr:tubulin-like doman-containing protein [Homoserinibacter gongjuensis]GMA93076.1 hypothetical protein GCM10025869_36050 [Homoserinibacter gongjuensis]